jgi:hypothetical protein
MEHSSCMKARILICALHLGHSRGAISYTRLMHADQELLLNSLL